MLETNFKLHADEKVILYIRRHWIFLVRDVAVTFLLFLTPTLLIWFLQFMDFVPDFIIFGVSFYSLTDVLVWMWGIFCWLFLAEKFTDYSLDFWILTNKRIVESELIKLFDTKLSTLELPDIEDISIQVSGFWQTMFGFGHLEVQTAGATREFISENIQNPGNVQKQIFDAKLALKKEEQDIEKGEFEQIAYRVKNKDMEIDHIPGDQKVINSKISVDTERQLKNSTNHDFAWAHTQEVESDEDIRKLEEELARLESKYKTNIDGAIRVE